MTTTFDPEIECRLLAIASLEPGWDGIAAAPIDPLRIESARWLLGRLPESWRRAARIVPMSYGRVQLEWCGPVAELELEFRTPHEVRWLAWIDLQHNTEGEFNLAMNIQEITDMIRQTLEPRS